VFQCEIGTIEDVQHNFTKNYVFIFRATLAEYLTKSNGKYSKH